MRALITGLALSCSLLVGAPAFAQMDEIIVTARRVDSGSNPGVFLEKKGDFILMEVEILNDSRDFATRLKEIEKTIEQIIDAAKAQPKIVLSIIDDSGIVRPLTLTNLSDDLRSGGRPDTNTAAIQIKTAIPETVDNTYELVNLLTDFAENLDDIETIGRSTISYDDEITVSIINPYQYRPELVKTILDDVNGVLKALGPDYRVIFRGMDQGMSWTRSGDLNLAFTMPYSYEILPSSLAIYIPNGVFDPDNY